MSDDHVADMFVFSNETVKGRKCWAGKSVGIVIAVSGAMLMILPATRLWPGPASAPCERVGAWGVWAFGPVFVSLGVALWRESVVRIWTIDRLAIGVHDARGQSKSLRWDAIERVRWDASGCRFQGHGERVDLPWKVIPRRQWPHVRKKIVQSLPLFNFSRRGRGVLLVAVFITAFMACLSFRVTMTVRASVIALASRMECDQDQDQVLKLVWMGLLIITLVPVRILFEPAYWYGRGSKTPSSTVTPEV